MFTFRNSYTLGGASDFWPLLIAVGIFAFVSPFLFETPIPVFRAMIAGVISILLGLTFKLNHRGVEIDSSRGLIRDYSTFFGVKKGDWFPMPEFKKVKLTSKKVESWNTPNGISPTFRSGVTTYSIGLFDDGDRPLYILQTSKRNRAIKAASTVSKLLSVDMEESL